MNLAMPWVLTDAPRMLSVEATEPAASVAGAKEMPAATEALGRLRARMI